MSPFPVRQKRGRCLYSFARGLYRVGPVHFRGDVSAGETVARTGGICDVDRHDLNFPEMPCIVDNDAITAPGLDKHRCGVANERTLRG